MSAGAALAALRRRGVVLHVDGARLRWAAPTGVMTAADIAALREHKGAVLTLLREEEAHSDAATLAETLRRRGPLTQGAAATCLGWGQTRAWQAEARLRAAGRARLDGLGRACLAHGEGDAARSAAPRGRARAFFRGRSE